MSVGIWQLVLILVIVFVLFGAGKLPAVMADVGKGIKSLKDAMGNKDSEEASAKTKNVQTVDFVEVDETPAPKKKAAPKKKSA